MPLGMPQLSSSSAIAGVESDSPAAAIKHFVVLDAYCMANLSMRKNTHIPEGKGCLKRRDVNCVWLNNDWRMAAPICHRRQTSLVLPSISSSAVNELGSTK